jgi:hypothetical protein
MRDHSVLSHHEDAECCERAQHAEQHRRMRAAIPSQLLDVDGLAANPVCYFKVRSDPDHPRQLEGPNHQADIARSSLRRSLSTHALPVPDEK